MSTFTLAISCLTTSNLPRFMDLTFQVPMQYCSLQTLDFTRRHIHNWALFLLWLRLFILSGAIYLLFSNNIWIPTDLAGAGGSSFSVISFCLYILFMGFSRQECWSGLPFPCPADHVLSELSIMNCPNWMALQGMAHSFTELGKAVVLGILEISELILWI